MTKMKEIKVPFPKEPTLENLVDYHLEQLIIDVMNLKDTEGKIIFIPMEEILRVVQEKIS